MKGGDYLDLKGHDLNFLIFYLVRCIFFLMGWKCLRLVLVAADHGCSFTENRISGKLAGAARSDSA